MATSQNGWPASQRSADYEPLSWITGRVHPDVHAIFDYLCERFDAEVEKVRKDWSWGWAYRPIRGASALSNHASGTAIDLNAPRHPLGKSGTFSAAQVRTIEAILDDLDGVIRWGGHYSGRKDEMHFEVWADREAVERVAAKLPDAPAKPTPKPTPKPKPTDWTEKLIMSLPLVRKGSRGANVRRVQALLTANGHRVAIDGIAGPKTDAATRAFQRSAKIAVDGIVGRDTWTRLLGQ